MLEPRGAAPAVVAVALSALGGCAQPGSWDATPPPARAITNASPIGTAAPATCPISDTAMTWSASLKCNQGTGGCKRNETGTITIQRTGPKTALVIADGIYRDGSAAFDPKSCTVSHSGLKPAAPFDLSISYAATIDASGALAGGAHVSVKDSIFACKGQYSVSGSKQ